MEKLSCIFMPFLLFLDWPNMWCIESTWRNNLMIYKENKKESRSTVQTSLKNKAVAFIKKALPPSPLLLSPRIFKVDKSL